MLQCCQLPVGASTALENVLPRGSWAAHPELEVWGTDNGRTKESRQSQQGPVEGATEKAGGDTKDSLGGPRSLGGTSQLCFPLWAPLCCPRPFRPLKLESKTKPFSRSHRSSGAVLWPAKDQKPHGATVLVSISKPWPLPKLRR